MRVITTLALLNGDYVAMLGHGLALVLNAVLVGQIAFYWKGTQLLLEAEKKKKKT